MREVLLVTGSKHFALTFVFDNIPRGYVFLFAWVTLLLLATFSAIPSDQFSPLVGMNGSLCLSLFGSCRAMCASRKTWAVESLSPNGALVLCFFHRNYEERWPWTFKINEEICIDWFGNEGCSLICMSDNPSTASKTIESTWMVVSISDM